MSKDWEDSLLSSGFPLEYEIGSMLLQAGFSFDGEYPYARLAGDSANEFSIDLQAQRYIPQGENSYSGTIRILCECKYRMPGKTWLFMPDLNDPDFSPSFIEGIRCFSSFTTFSFDERVIRRFSSKFDAVLKGVEINTNTGEVFDKDVRHAVNQLRYAMPSIISSEIQFASVNHPDDCKPFFVLPLLIVNCPLRLLKADTTLDKVRSAKILDDISDEVEVVDIRSAFAREFVQHCEKVFSEIDLQTIKTRDSTFEKIERHSKKHKKFNMPLNDLDRLKSGDGPSPGCFTQFLIVTLKALPSLINDVDATMKQGLQKSAQYIFASGK